ncbi:MAG: hypothetical protein IJB78_06815 [Oscillospiraceae bacterium]|nr:hypothetical protein [Oscillospiraceae bacterium]
MKKILISLACLLLLIFSLSALFLLSLKARTDVYLKAFELSEDGKTMTLHVGLSSSAGYLRKMVVKQGGDNKYITFYSTPGINSKIGAKDTFELELQPITADIYFYSGNGSYRKVLESREDGMWYIVN